MLAPFATLAFLTALWLVAKLMLDLAGDDGRKIVAALLGQSMVARPPQSLKPVSVRFHPPAGPVRRPLHATPEWRAAA